MYTPRKAITINSDGDSALTLVKPFSNEHPDDLFVIYEDAYGEMYGILTPISIVREKFNGTDEEFSEILERL